MWTHQHGRLKETFVHMRYMRGSRGGWGQGVLGFLSNTGQHPLKNRGIAYSGIWILSPLINNVIVGPPLTRLSGSAHAILPKTHVGPTIYC